jgi:hypothetical protein
MILMSKWRTNCSEEPHRLVFHVWLASFIVFRRVCSFESSFVSVIRCGFQSTLNDKERQMDDKQNRVSISLLAIATSRRVVVVESKADCAILEAFSL